MVAEAIGTQPASPEKAPSFTAQLFSYARSLREPVIWTVKIAALVALPIGIKLMAFSPTISGAMGGALLSLGSIMVLNKDIEGSRFFQKFFTTHPLTEK